MMKLLDTDGAWLAIGISVFFLLVGVVMKQVIVKVLKQEAPAPDADTLSGAAQSRQHD